MFGVSINVNDKTAQEINPFLQYSAKTSVSEKKNIINTEFFRELLDSVKHSIFV